MVKYLSSFPFLRSELRHLLFNKERNMVVVVTVIITMIIIIAIITVLHRQVLDFAFLKRPDLSSAALTWKGGSSKRLSSADIHRHTDPLGALLECKFRLRDPSFQ